MVQSKAKLFLCLLTYYLVGIIFLILSLSRKSFFLEHLENFSLENLNIIHLSFAFLFSAYSLIFFEKQAFKLKKLILIVFPLILLYLLIPPFFSRDAASYVIIAKNFLWLGQNPYLGPIANPLNPWVKELGQIWWLSYPSPYGPIFLLIPLFAVLPKLSLLITTVYLYKIAVAVGYFLSIYLFGLLTEKQNEGKTVFLLALNPAILVHVLIDGHNEIFIILAMLWFLYLRERGLVRESFLVFLSSVYLKFNTILFLPIFWFAKRKISLEKVLVTAGLSVISFFVFLRIFQWNPADFFKNLFFVSSGCFYSCFPFVILNHLLLGNSFKSGMMFSFLLAYLIVFYRFLITENQLFKFIFWAFIAFAFLGIAWLAPWYLVLIIPIGLLIEGRVYQIMTLFLTFYSLFHFFGI